MKFEKTKQEESELEYANFLGKDKLGPEEKSFVKQALESLELPKRGTPNSAGYDLRCPFDVSLANSPDGSCKALRIPTFVKFVGAPQGVALLAFNRSSVSLNDGIGLDNAAAVIDGDFERCICVQFSGDASKRKEFKKGDKIAQCVIVNYLTAENDETQNGKRNGGVGSTGRK